MGILKQYLDEIGQYAILTKDEEQAYAMNMANEKLSQEERDYYRELLISHNLKLVVSIAKNYENNHMELMDLIQEGNLGLMVAVEKFDPSLGFRFSTCATPWIRSAITKSLQDKGKNIRIPAHIYNLLSKYRQVLDDLARNGIEYSQAEIAKRLGITEEKVGELEGWRYDTVSLSTPLSDGEDEDTLEDLQQDNVSENGFQYTSRIEMENHIQQVIKTLKPRTQQIIKMRFGLGKVELGDPEDWTQEHTLDEVGAAVGLTRERVRQIEKETIGVLRSMLPELKNFFK